MKIRIRFTKMGPIKFIGHLDMMRYFQKAIRRSHLPVRYSEGFSPHQIMSFASPLGIGIESMGEYVDIEVDDRLSDDLTSDRCIDMLNAVMTDGVVVTDFLKLPDDMPKAMSQLGMADIDAIYNEDIDDEMISKIKKCIDLLSDAKTYMISKESKSGIKEMDIRPLIYHISCDRDKISMRIAHASENYLQPIAVLEAISSYDTSVQDVIMNADMVRQEMYDREGRKLSEYGINIT